MKVFFVDRDGVINKEVGYLHEISKFEFIEGTIDGLKTIINKGYKIIIVTNQSGIGRGMYDINAFEILNDWMLKKFESKGVKILDVFFCPHSPNENCSCRKPKPGLFLEAQKKFNIDMEQSWSIGDKETDVEAASLSGITNTVLVRSGHKINETTSKSNFIIDSLANIVELKI